MSACWVYPYFPQRLKNIHNASHWIALLTHRNKRDSLRKGRDSKICTVTAPYPSKFWLWREFDSLHWYHYSRAKFRCLNNCLSHTNREQKTNVGCVNFGDHCSSGRTSSGKSFSPVADSSSRAIRGLCKWGSVLPAVLCISDRPDRPTSRAGSTKSYNSDPSSRGTLNS